MSDRLRTGLLPRNCQELPAISVFFARTHACNDVRCTMNRCTMNRCMMLDTSSRYTMNDESIVRCPIPINDGIAHPYLDEELKVRFGYDYLRTPRNETLIVENAEYLGVAEVINSKFKTVYTAHYWAVDFLRAGGKDFNTPLRGLLQIKTSSWHNAGLGEPSIALRGRCAIIENKASGLSIERRDSP